MNKVVLIGRLTKDPELKYTPGDGTAICRITVAVARAFKKDETDFINCVAFGKTGETIAQYFTKGRQIALAGNIRTGSYQAQDGTKMYTTNVIIENFEFVGNNSNNQSTWSEQDNSDGSFEDMTPVDDGDMPF
jgi:single-strand DNA-binding protein